MTLSITIRKCDTQNNDVYPKCHYALGCLKLIVTITSIMQKVIMLNVVAPLNTTHYEMVYEFPTMPAMAPVTNTSNCTCFISLCGQAICCPENQSKYSSCCLLQLTPNPPPCCNLRHNLCK
jgi:hypothetical protein